MDRNSLGYQAIIHRQEVLEKQFTQLFTHVYALSLELNKLKNGGETVKLERQHLLKKEHLLKDKHQFRDRQHLRLQHQRMHLMQSTDFFNLQLVN
jgi:hypothetical protein